MLIAAIHDRAVAQEPLHGLDAPSVQRPRPGSIAAEGDRRRFRIDIAAAHGGDLRSGTAGEAYGPHHRGDLRWRRLRCCGSGRARPLIRVTGRW